MKCLTCGVDPGERTSGLCACPLCWDCEIKTLRELVSALDKLLICYRLGTNRGVGAAIDKATKARELLRMNGGEAMKRFWISWYQPVEDGDYRPIYDPKKESEPFEHRYWCSGETGDGRAVTMCAVVDAKTEAAAWKAVKKYWPDYGEVRFANEVALDWTPGDRFPMRKGKR